MQPFDAMAETLRPFSSKWLPWVESLLIASAPIGTIDKDYVGCTKTSVYQGSYKEDMRISLKKE